MFSPCCSRVERKYAESTAQDKKNALEDNVVQRLLQERVVARDASGRLFDLGQIKFAALPSCAKYKIDPSSCSHILSS